MTKTAILAAGCFWGIEEKFSSIAGVVDTEVGYIGGDIIKPSYEQVCTGTTNHAEAVRIYFDEDHVSFDELLDIFFSKKLFKIFCFSSLPKAPCMRPTLLLNLLSINLNF